MFHYTLPSRHIHSQTDIVPHHQKVPDFKIADSDLWHSFAQYIERKDSDLYVLEQSEGSRYTNHHQYLPSGFSHIPPMKS